MLKNIPCICILYIFTSCNLLTDNVEDLFGGAQPLKGQYMAPLSGETYKIPDSWPLALLDGQFIMGIMGDSTYSFAAMETATKSFHKIVRTEVIPTPSAGYLVKENDSTLFYRGLSLNRMGYRQGEFLVQSIPWQPDRSNTAFLYPLRDGGYLQVGSSDKRHLVSFLDGEGKEQKAGIALPAFMEDYDLKFEPITYIQGILLKHPDVNTFVYVSKTVNPYCIFFRMDDRNRFIKIKEYMMGEFTPVIDDREVFYRFQGGAVEDGLVYLSFLNLGKEELLAFNWEGEPVQRYEVDFDLTVLSEQGDKGVIYAKGKQGQVSGVFQLAPK